MKLPPKRKSLRSEILRGPKREFPKHRKFVRSFACAVPGCLEGPIEFAHIRSAANSGTGIKPGDWYGIPLHSGHHAEQHQIGQPAFARKYSLDLVALAHEFARQSPDLEMKQAMREQEHD